MKAPAVIAYTHDYLDWNLGSGHPTNPERARIAVQLLREMADSSRIDLAHLVPVLDWERVGHEAALVHTHEYIRALHEGRNDNWAGTDTRLGDVAALMFTGTVDLVEQMLRDRAEDRVGVYFNPQGAKHHAQRDHGSGFCALNDMAWAATRLTGLGLKVAYVDWDAHHGDGVEAILADNPDALTFSIHNGDIYPGTGRDGHDVARGIYNWALPSGSATPQLYEAMQEIWPIITDFRPDVLLVACGADGLDGDPLGGLHYDIFSVIKSVSYPLGCLAGKLGASVVIGGAGGYLPLDQTPQAWAQWVRTIYGGLSTHINRNHINRKESL